MQLFRLLQQDLDIDVVLLMDLSKDVEHTDADIVEDLDSNDYVVLFDCRQQYSYFWTLQAIYSLNASVFTSYMYFIPLFFYIHPCNAKKIAFGI